MHIALKHRKEYVALCMLRDERYAASVGKRIVNSKNKRDEKRLKAIEAQLTIDQVKAFLKASARLADGVQS